jgi:methionyl-tRNA formyltransferase
MRLAFAGTPEFAAATLAALLEAEAGHEIALVLTQPDRPAGRGMRCVSSPVRQLALARGLEILQPVSLKQDAAARERITTLGVEALIVVAYGLILPQAVLDAPRLGCLNLHASLLPRWRGAAPIQRAILAGDAETGVCVMQMEAGLDTGPVLARVKTPIQPDDNAASLHDRLAALGARLMVETLPRLPLAAEAQPGTGVTYAAKLEKAEAHLDWSLPATELDRRIRAFNPFPVAQTLLAGALLKIWQAEIVSTATGAAAAGTVLAVDKNGITVACGQGALRLTELQKAGGKRLAAARFVAGHALKVGETRLG